MGDDVAVAITLDDALALLPRDLAHHPRARGEEGLSFPPIRRALEAAGVDVDSIIIPPPPPVPLTQTQVLATLLVVESVVTSPT